MLKGCILAIIVLAGAYYAESYLLGPMHLPFTTALAPILALGVTLSVTGIYGLPQSMRGWKKEVGDIAGWNDGDMVQVIGRLKAVGQPLKAPASQRDALIYEYNITSEKDRPNSEDGPPTCKLWGLDACDCVLLTDNGSVKVTGFAPLQQFEASTFGGEAYLPQTAKFIIGRKWSARPKLSWDLIANPALIVGSKTGEWEGDVATEEADEKLLKGLADKGERGEAQLLNRLRGGNWVVEERIVPPFAYVKLRGRYKKDLQALDINLSIKDAVGGIEPAKPGEKASSEKVPALINLALIVAATIAAHYAIYNENGKIYSDFIKWLRF